MTSTVIHMTHSVDRTVIQKIFMKFANKYGTLWTSRLGVQGDWQFCEDDWYEEISRFDLEHVRIAMKECLVIYKDFPPTQGQFISLCLKASGLPDQTQVIKLMVAKDFSHPIVKRIYDRIGSWKMANGTEKEIASITASAYDEAVADFQANPEQEWVMLKAYNNQKAESNAKALPEPDKIPSNAERRGFKERLDEYLQRLKDAKANPPEEACRLFDKNAINPQSRFFDQATYDDYRKYLLSISEERAIFLPPAYTYDRHMLLNALNQSQEMRSQQTNANPRVNNCDQSRSSGEAANPFKNWQDNDR